MKSVTVGGWVLVTLLVLGLAEASGHSSPVLWAAGALWIAIAGTVLANCLLFQLELHPDRLEWRSVSNSRTIHRNQLSGWRVVAVNRAQALELHFKNPSEKAARIPLYFARDAAFNEWLAIAPNLVQADSLSRRTGRQAMNATDNEERLAVMNRARWVVRGSIAGLVAVIGSVALGPFGQYSIFALLAFPWMMLALARGSHGLIRIEAKNDDQPSLAFPFFSALLFTGFVAFSINVTGWGVAAATCLAYGLCLWLASLAADPALRSSRARSLGFLVLVVMAGFGPPLVINRLLDRSTARHFHYSVIDKRESQGRYASRVLLLKRANENAPDIAPAHVSPRIFAAARIGDPYCIAMHDGALAIQWYEPVPCPEEPDVTP